MTTSLALSFREALRSCELCDLRTGCKSPVPWYGDVEPDIAIMGEAPGKQEDIEGRPFTGKSGIQLASWLKQVGYKPHQVTYLNAVSCFPGRGLSIPGDMGYVNVCRRWWRGQLEFIRPKMLITLGVVAYSAIRGTHFPKLANLHGAGQYIDITGVGQVKWVATYHPSAFLRGSKKYEDKILDDLRFAKSWDGMGMETCYVRGCEDEVATWDDFCTGFCSRHGLRQGLLWPENVEDK